MAQMHKLELKTRISSSPDRIYDIYKNKTYLMPKISPDKLQSFQVLEGDGKSVGSVRLWTYVMGVPVMAKDRIAAVDEDNKSITFELIDGEVTKYFRNFRATLDVSDRNAANWSLEYDKASEDAPNLGSYLEFLVNMVREVDAYLLKQY